VAIKARDEWVNSSSRIREEVVAYSTNYFSSTRWEIPTLEGVTFPSLSEEENEGLSKIETSIKKSDGNKSLGPNDFNFIFAKVFWELLKGEVKVLLDQFNENGRIPKSFLLYFVSLIHKINSPFGLSNFRPISLLGCLYKIMSKVLAARLSKVMNLVIATSQSAFLKRGTWWIE
jgi:hypothetical protein